MLFKELSEKIAGTDDQAKLLIWLPKVLLSGVYLWPEIRDTHKKITVCTFFVLYFLGIAYGIVFFIKDNTFVDGSSGILTLSNISQAITKTIMIYYYGNRIRNVLREIWEKFWPVSVDSEVLEIVKGRYSIVLNGIVAFIVSTFIFVIGVAVAPLLLGNGKALPYPTVYPFDWTVNPVYPIVFTLQTICDVLIPVIVLGYDFLFFSLCFTITAQYLCLHRVIRKLGTKEMGTVIQKLGYDSDEIPDNHDDISKLFIKIFIKQHVTLVRITQEIEDIFNIAAFLQLFNSMLAMCISCLITTMADTDMMQIIYLFSALLAYFMQLAIYCAHGNELSYQANLLQDYIFGSNWYEIESVKTKEQVILLLRGSSATVKLTALKFFNINFATFIQVLRVSFSFFTLLSTVTN